MKKTLTIIMLCGVISGYAQNTPHYAASTKTWTFGRQTWSDVIHFPECYKTSLTESYADPQCRRYTLGGKHYYYYNWPYVDMSKSWMCPSPWRMPTKEDFQELINNVKRIDLKVKWGLGGFADGQSLVNKDYGFNLWSATDYDRYAAWYYSNDKFGTNLTIAKNKRGMQIRCVK